MGYRVAIVGATGAVGRELLNVLHERGFPIDKLYAVASSNSEGKEVSFGEEETLKVQSIENTDFSEVDISFFSAGGKVSEEYAVKAGKEGGVVIDNTSSFRMNPEVPLVVPEVNREALVDFRNFNIVSNPNCSTIQMVVALKPLHDLAIIKRVVVSTYQSVSGAGRSAMDELFQQTRKIFFNQEIDKEIFSKQIAYNVIPQIDIFLDDGSTKEEDKMVKETKKILSESIEVSATCVRVPTFIGHAESVNIEFINSISIEEAISALQTCESIAITDLEDKNLFITPKESAGTSEVFISRLREDNSVVSGLNMWIVADNLRKGAALNSIQIAEAMIEDGYL